MNYQKTTLNDCKTIDFGFLKFRLPSGKPFDQNSKVVKLEFLNMYEQATHES